jgi:TolA-binding protein
MSLRTTKISIIACALLYLAAPFYALAQEEGQLLALSKKIIDAKSREEAYLALEEVTDLYFKENRYNEYVAFLNSLLAKKQDLVTAVNYYIGEARYYQLRHLEETQNWQEYFDHANAYKEEVRSYLEKAIYSLEPSNALGVYARLVLWKFHRDQDDPQAEAALNDLLKSVLAYSQKSANVVPIKDAAGELEAYGEKARARELYRVYVDKIVASGEIADDELKSIALGFYREGNLDLSETIYNLYIERLQKSSSKEIVAGSLRDIAKLFAYADNKANDPPYAEKVFAKIESVAGKEALDEEMEYLCAYNLEKNKELIRARDVYLDLAQRYPQSAHLDEAVFKAGIIYTYISRDVKNGRMYFEKLAGKEAVSPQAVSSLYQLGLLSQWEADMPKAQEYYNKLLEKAGQNYAETVHLAQERLKEINSQKPMEYNLKTFLDVSLKEEHTGFDMSKIDLKASFYRPQKDQDDNISATTYLPSSGCLQQEVQYLWSGHLGKTWPASGQSAFSTAYIHPGTKEINLVVVSISGIIDRSLEMVDVSD